MHSARGGLVAVLAMVVVGCAAPPAGTAHSPGPATSAAPAPTPTGTLDASTVAGLSVELREARTERADRVVRLRVRNDTDADLHLSAGELETPHLEEVATTDPEWGRPLPAGGAREAPVALGPPRCDVPPRAGSARFVVTDERGVSAPVDLVVSDPYGLLARIHAEDCARAAVAAGAELAIGDTLTTRQVDGGLVATIELLVTPVDGGPEVVVEAVDGTVLFRPPGGGSWPVQVRASDGPASVELPLVPTRCDPHAVAEDKRGTFFGVRTVVDGVPQAVHHLPVSPSLGSRLYDFVGEHCGW